METVFAIVAIVVTFVATLDACRSFSRDRLRKNITRLERDMKMPPSDLRYLSRGPRRGRR